MPPLPDAHWWYTDDSKAAMNMNFGIPEEKPLFTAEQMRAYRLAGNADSGVVHPAAHPTAEEAMSALGDIFLASPKNVVDKFHIVREFIQRHLAVPGSTRTSVEAGDSAPSAGGEG